MSKSPKVNPEAVFTVLQIISYDDVNIMIRRFPMNMFVWDFVLDGKWYSNYVVLNPSKGKKDLTSNEVKEVIKIAYAGAAASIDQLKGKEMSDTDKHIIEQFEKGRIVVNGEA